MSNMFDTTLPKFLLVGVANTAVGAVIMFLLFNVAQCSYWVSSAASYVAGGILSFFLNKFFTFQNRKKSVAQALLFVLNLAVCYLVAYVAAKRIVYAVLANQSETVKGNAALCTGIVLYTALNYLGQRIFVFKEGQTNGQ